MKKRRTMIVALILVATLTIGIGYANFTDELSANATANVNTDASKAAFDADVHFDASYDLISKINSNGSNDAGTNAAYIDAGMGATAHDKAEFTISKLGLMGERSIFIFKIVNESKEFSAKLTSSSTVSAHQEYFDIKYCFTTDDTTPVADDSTDWKETAPEVTLDKAVSDTEPGVIYLRVKITLKADPITPLTGSFGSVSISAAPQR